MTETEQRAVTKDSRLSGITGLLPLSSILTILIMIWLVYAFLSGGMYTFYASALFLFYALTKKMWVSVILLGVFQTILLIPLRIIRVMRSDNIDEFQKDINRLPDEALQRQQIKKQFHLGSRPFLFYVTDFLIQLTTFLTIGRLFLTDFYSRQIPPDKLYSFVPYPDYPITDTFFKIPYPAIGKTIDFGWKGVILFWLVLAICQVVIVLVRRALKRQKDLPSGIVQSQTRYTLGYFLLFFILSWIVMRNFPINWRPAIFSGSVAVPNRTLNTVTALATFGTLLWFGSQKIIRKSSAARKKGIDERTIEDTRKKMFSETVFDSGLVGLGAYFITNQIPSAFELSIFTLEVISLLSPFTLDKLILKVTHKDTTDKKDD
jgi:hypothetical protein